MNPKLSQNLRNRTPAQDKLKSEIANLESTIVHLKDKKSRGIASDEEEVQLKTMNNTLKLKQQQLKAKLSDQLRQQKARDLYKHKIEEIKSTNPEVALQVTRRSQRGRPRLEESQPELLKAIVDIATYGCGADERRRTENIRTVHTLDELTTQLHSRGFEVRF